MPTRSDPKTTARTAARAAPGALHPLLAAVPASGLREIVAAAEPFERTGGSALLNRGEPIGTLFFVTSGLVATIGRTPSGEGAETGLVGRGGLIGHTALLGEIVARTDAVAVTKTRGIAVARQVAERVLPYHPGSWRALLDHALARSAEAERLCVCAAVHPVERRLGRWLLRAGALTEGPIEVTHQSLADLLGVRRASVTTSLHLLEGEQAVWCRRGRIEIRNAGRLTRLACDCAGV
ncbi:MAG: Crp/Fnr family transcriptional regulator [Hansschlegelia sp.]